MDSKVFNIHMGSKYHYIYLLGFKSHFKFTHGFQVHITNAQLGFDQILLNVHTR